MTVSERAAARAVELHRKRAEDEVRALVEAGLTVLRQRGAAGLTVAEVLAEAGLSTRAFYRHFRSKDELVLAVYEQESQRRNADIERACCRRRIPAPALETWVDETLGLGFEPRRARRTQVLARRRRALASRLPRRVRDDPGRCSRSVDRAARGVPRCRTGARRVVDLRDHLGAGRGEAAGERDRPGGGARPRARGSASRRSGFGRAMDLPPTTPSTSTPSTRPCRARSWNRCRRTCCSRCCRTRTSTRR